MHAKPFRIRHTLFLVALCVAILILLPAGSLGAAPGRTVSVAVNERPVDFPDQGAFIDRTNRTLVPVRPLAEAFNSAHTAVQIHWDGEERSVTIHLRPRNVAIASHLREEPSSATEKVIRLKMGASTATVNGREIPLDAPAQIYNDRTMVPLRFVSEALGARVQYRAETRHVDIFYNDPRPPEPAPNPDASLPDSGEQVTHFLVSNPYREIDWEKIQRHRSALHFHTDRSDGDLDPTVAVNRYRNLGFTVMSITDHDDMGNPRPTWPWPYVPPGVLPIMGNELSYQHHITSYFTDYYGHPGGSEHESLAAVQARGGLSTFAHPGRYKSPEEWEWYVPYYEQHESLFGLEVFNMGDRFPTDRKLWDNLLTHFMPDRPIYGLSNDDMHLERVLGINWNTLLLPELSAAAVREALTGGRFFFSVSLERTAPEIERILFHEGAIEIVTDHGHVRWISAGKLIHEGRRLEYQDNPLIDRYARASVTTAEGKTYTQPFGFRTQRQSLQDQQDQASQVD